MALIKCVECGQEYSDKAEACPKCACPTTAQITKEKVEEVAPEVIEEEEQTTEKKRLTVGKVLRRGVGALFVIGLIVNANIQKSERREGEVVEEAVAQREAPPVRKALYSTESEAMKACMAWTQYQYENQELIVYARQNNLPLDELVLGSGTRAVFVTGFRCYNRRGSRQVWATGGIHHHEYFRSDWDWENWSFVNVAANAEARVRELIDEVGIDPEKVYIYRPYKPGFDPESCDSSSEDSVTRRDPSKTYCPRPLSDRRTSRRFNGIDLYIRKNNLNESDAFIWWKEGELLDAPITVFPYLYAD